MKAVVTRCTFLLWTLSFCIVAEGQTCMPGEFIVMFHKSLDVREWSAEYGLEHVNALSPRAHIHLFRAQSKTTSAQDWAVLRTLREDLRIEAAQFHHTVQNRETLPNDPQLGQQWHHVEYGDHDIDSDLAWDITTGGAAADGSRIVVAVLEGGGSNYNHVDLIDNHWVNEAEIPGNGVDDDENGFVDDYNGWNSGSNNDAIAAGGHGTSVSGMIGAVGDNGVGGVGVNWDVDIMQVDMGGGLTESNVIAAYNYPYEMRAIFNESDGARGAFVVATNASWGIDLANPANYPVWCAYYDDLGEQGILNCGATANAQYNIDTQGDMPTGCSSPYMVAVTATNDNDVRTFSGYGATTIDLGAPGEAVFLPSGTSGYGNTSGTSFASPCVAGAIALVYSAPCPDLMGLALSNPQAAADLVRGYILDGTDEVSNLIGETVTGGRLNVYNALELALANCGPIECSTDSIYASSYCVYDPSLGEAVTEIELGVELGSFLCSTTTVCQSSDLDSLGSVCDSLMIASGETYTFTGMYPSANYEFYVTVDSLVSETVMVSTPACDTLVPGCTIAVDAYGNEALNFDPLATIDDGSCEFPCVDFSLTILTDCWPEEVGWELVLGESVVASVDAGGYSEAETEVSFEQCLTEGCYTFVLTDEYGDGLNGAAWNQCGVDGNYTATDSSGTVLFQMGEADYGDEIQHEFCLPAVFGCTNPDACNFDALANTDNGLCEVPGDACDDGDENTVFDVIGDDCMCAGVQAEPYPVYEIVDVRGTNNQGVLDSMDISCELRGIVHGWNDYPQGLRFTLIDETHGINVFSAINNFGYEVQEGDSLRVRGIVGQFAGLATLYADTVIFEGGGFETQGPLLVEELNEDSESQFVKLECVTIVQPEQWTNVFPYFEVVVDYGLDQFTMRIDGNTDLWGMPVPTGSFSIAGLGGQFDAGSPFFDGYTLTPLKLEDLIEQVPYSDCNGLCFNDVDGDGICDELEVYGCSEFDACNFNPGATEDDGTCDYSCFGCTDSEALNWDETATVDDGSCTYFETSCAFIGSEEWADLGAGLFAEVEVLTHEFGVVGDGALVLSLPEVMEEPATGNAFAVMAWNDLTVSGLPNGFTLSNAPTSMDPGTQVCLTYSGTPVEEGMFDVLVSGELVLSVFGQPYPVGPYSSTVPMLITPNVSGIVGCTYPNATNYLSYATIESGTCTFEGCMDPEANNFQTFALSDDGSCEYDECASTCPSDVDGDGSVGTGDLLSMLASFGLVCE